MSYLDYKVRIEKPIRGPHVICCFDEAKEWSVLVQEWSAENLEGGYVVGAQVSGLKPVIEARFELLEDAVLFRLRWC